MTDNLKKKTASIAQKKEQTAASTDTDFISQLPWWTPLVMLVFTAIVYSNSLTNGFTNFDDDFYVINNPYLKELSWENIKTLFTTFYMSNYHPLTMVTYLFEYSFHNESATTFHLVNLSLHLLNTYLAYRLAKELSGKALTGLLVGTLFGIHPMHVESVAWISELKDVLYAAFFLSGLLVYLKYLSTGNNKKYYLLLMLLFIGSLLSKPTAVSFPLILLCIDYYKDRQFTTKVFIEKAPLLLLSVVVGIITLKAQNTGGSIHPLTTTHGFIDRIFLFTYGLSAYLTNLIAPVKLSAIHPFPNVKANALPWLYYASLPFLVAIVVLVVKNKLHRKEVMFGSLFFLLSIAVMLQVIVVGSAVYAERYTYISYFGLFYIAAHWATSYINTEKRKIISGITILFLVGFSAISWNRISVWKDGNTLFTDVIEKYPDNYFAYWMRGNLNSAGGNMTEAGEYSVADYTAGIKCNPEFEALYYNRGLVYMAQGAYKNAIADFSSCIKINPKSAESYNDRGWAYYKMADNTNAYKDINYALQLDPNFAEAYNNRGWLNGETGKITEAYADYTKALQVKPDYHTPLYNRAALKANIHDFNAALQDYAILTRLEPNDNTIYYNMGLIYYNMKDNRACDYWKKAADMGNPDASALFGKFCR